ncbi:putative DNA segregation ATPase FtsK/SpoIIIE [Pseudomonas phage HU1]|nr:putative DNA segregation ATPase FtsK/SpoIIIE [Pseudomonas phage HU1]
MKREHQVIIAKARREGMKPVELATELMGYTLVEAMREASAANSIPYSKMSEIQQDAAIQTWTDAVKESIDLAIQVIASGGTRTVRMDLTTVTVGKKLKVAGTVDGNEEYKHDLIDLANDQGTAIVILNERDYLQALDGITGEKDQKPLDLEDDGKPDGKKTAQKAKASTEKKIELTPKLITDGREFVTLQQNASIAGLQNYLHVGYDKADALLKLYEGEGLVKFVGTDQSGQYEIVRAGTAPAAPSDPDLYGELTYSQVQQTVVLHATNFELAWLSTRFKIDEERASHLCLQLLDDGVIAATHTPDLDAEPQYTVIAKLEDLTI